MAAPDIRGRTGALESPDAIVGSVIEPARAFPVLTEPVGVSTTIPPLVVRATPPYFSFQKRSSGTILARQASTSSATSRQRRQKSLHNAAEPVMPAEPDKLIVSEAA